ncbi:aminoglycoside 3'-phosphotransferase [Devosia sp. BK]|uniref:APH(3') family aminoglycoside O-phosphotransferase n=1 Tax=Devosia sp. BK TaxID=2871706 RepID=UPI0029395F55|nr:APH(3') family aminoglycoside O-phosphotransferase [Devosia sp. BK]MDV3250915.1 aminoglycoside 3'-phosphotransferase [Devosia sp. BK]
MDPRERLPLQFNSLAGRDWQTVTIGKSGASVWRIPMGETALFLKAEPAHELSELSQELLRLDYLAEMGFPAPRIVDEVTADAFNWLLMTEVKGRDLTHLVDQPQVLIQVLADGLKRLHALDPAQCLFEHSIDQRLRDGEANMLAGRVDETDFDDRHESWTARQVYDWLQANRPAETDRVVTHGDASLPNFLAHEGRFSGIVDCARLGVADRWQDLALACWSLEFNGGMDMVHAFLDAYGVQFDAERYRFYCALDELF